MFLEFVLAEDDSFSGDNTIDMLIEDQLIKHELQHASTTEDPIPTKEPLTSNDIKGYTKVSDLSSIDNSTTSVENLVDTVTASKPTEQTSYPQQITTEQTETTEQTKTTTEAETTVLTTQARESSVVVQTTQPTISSPVPTRTTPLSAAAPSTTAKPWKTPKVLKLSTDSNKEVEDDLRKVIGKSESFHIKRFVYISGDSG